MTMRYFVHIFHISLDRNTTQAPYIQGRRSTIEKCDWRWVGGDLRQLLTTALPLLIFPLIFCMRSRVRAGQLMTAILILIMMRRPTMTTNSRTHMYAPHPTRYISTPAQTHHSLLCTHARNAFDLICLLRPNRHTVSLQPIPSLSSQLTPTCAVMLASALRFGSLSM